jgi:hypothetical protein
MRDIRSDLQDRASLLEEQINSTKAQFESLVEQLRAEHESKLADLKVESDAVNRLLEVEQRRLADVPVTPAPIQATNLEPQLSTQAHSLLPHQHTPAQAMAQPHIQTHGQSHAQPHMQSRPQYQAQHAQPDSHFQQPAAELVQQQQQPLADLLVCKLNEQGAMSRDDLKHVALQRAILLMPTAPSAG